MKNNKEYSVQVETQDNYNNEERIADYKRTKDESIREEIILQNIPLVKRLAYEYGRPIALDIDDLIDAGAIGLINAVDNYQEGKAKFSTFATESIQREISICVSNWYGEDNRYYGGLIKKYELLARKAFGKTVDIHNEEIVDFVLDAMIENNDINKEAAVEIRSRILSKKIIEAGKEEVENIPYEEEFNRTAFIDEHIEELCSVLTDKEIELLNQRFVKRIGLKEIAKQKNKTPQAIQQREKKALAKMRPIVVQYL